jgi:hypothetical protein
MQVQATGSDHQRTCRYTKAVARFAWIVLLAAQSLAVAHYHPVNSFPELASQVQRVADADLCALCNLAMHTPLESGALPFIQHSLIAIVVAPAASPVSRLSSVQASLFSRAPPAAA